MEFGSGIQPSDTTVGRTSIRNKEYQMTDVIELAKSKGIPNPPDTWMPELTTTLEKDGCLIRKGSFVSPGGTTIELGYVLVLAGENGEIVRDYHYVKPETDRL